MRLIKFFIIITIFSLSCGSIPHSPTTIIKISSPAEASESTYIILNKIKLISPHAIVDREFWGTGFNCDNNFITARHVIMPEEYDSDVRGYIRNEFIVTKDIYIWPYGQRIADKDSNILFESSYKIEKFLTLKSSGKGFKVNNYHVETQTDFMVYSFNSSPLTKPLKYRNVKHNDLLSDCYLIGYFGGVSDLDSKSVIPFISKHNIAKISFSLFTTGAIFGGCSGGPIVDEEGIVIGVVSSGARNILSDSVYISNVMSSLAK